MGQKPADPRGPTATSDLGNKPPRCDPRGAGCLPPAHQLAEEDRMPRWAPGDPSWLSGLCAAVPPFIKQGCQNYAFQGWSVS